MLPKNNAPTPSSAAKVKGKSNGNILNFFKKADSSSSLKGSNDGVEDSLFLEENPMKKEEVPTQTPTPPRDYDPPESQSRQLSQTVTDEVTPRFNEDPVPVKRRRVEESAVRPTSSPSKKPDARPQKGPFVEDSDSDDEMTGQISASTPAKITDWSAQPSIIPTSEIGSEEQPLAVESERPPLVPSLQRENTSIVEQDEFERIEDFIDDEFPEEGEEFLERRWMEEQRELELGLERDEDAGQDPEESICNLENAKDIAQDSGAASCPICSGSFADLTDEVWRELLSSGS